MTRPESCEHSSVRIPTDFSEKWSRRNATRDPANGVARRNTHVHPSTATFPHWNQPEKSRNVFTRRRTAYCSPRRCTKLVCRKLVWCSNKLKKWLQIIPQLCSHQTCRTCSRRRNCSHLVPVYSLSLLTEGLEKLCDNQGTPLCGVREPCLAKFVAIWKKT